MGFAEDYSRATSGSYWQVHPAIEKEQGGDRVSDTDSKPATQGGPGGWWILSQRFALDLLQGPSS